MNYKCSKISETLAKVELVPTSKTEQDMLASFVKDNEEHLNTLYHHFGEGLKKCTLKSTIVGINGFRSFPRLAVINIEHSGEIGI